MIKESKTEILREIEERRKWMSHVEEVLNSLPDGYEYWLGSISGNICVDIPMNEEIVAEFTEGIGVAGWEFDRSAEHEDEPYNTKRWKHESLDVKLIAYIRGNMVGSTCAVLSRVVERTIFYTEKGCANV